MSDLDAWIGRSEAATDIASARQVARLAALLDHDAPPWREGLLPPLAHWLLFPPVVAQSRVATDGHPHPGGLIPDTGLPRRMWAGGRIEFRGDIAIGETVERRTTLLSARRKAGRSGELVFVTLRHEIGQAIVEEQDIVYRAMPASSDAALADAAAASPAQAPAMARVRGVVADPVRLFRYSALTFNSHRIHYDRDYAMQVEGYPGLVVQGPYIATLLMDHFLHHSPGSMPSGFSFRAVSPLFDGENIALGLTETATGADLTAVGPDGRLAMQARVTL